MYSLAGWNRNLCTETNSGKCALLLFYPTCWLVKSQVGIRVKVQRVKKVSQGLVHITLLPQQSRYSPVRLHVLQAFPGVRNINLEI